MTKDQVGPDGQAGPDGVDDPDVQCNDCAGSTSGPMGKLDRCVALLPPVPGQPFNLCLAGTTFATCGTTADCSTGESCQLQFILGEYGPRCAARPVNYVTVGQVCHLNPDLGDVAYCESRLCRDSDVGPGICSAVCNDDADCDGLSCQPVVVSAEPEMVVPICLGVTLSPSAWE